MPSRMQDANGVWWVQTANGNWAIAVDQGNGPGPNPYDQLMGGGNPLGGGSSGGNLGGSGGTFDLNPDPTNPYGGGGRTSLGGGGGGGGGSNLWPLLFSTGGQILGDYFNKRTADKQRNQGRSNTNAALAELTPEALHKMMTQFYGQNYAQMMPQMQGAQQGLAVAAGRRGLTGSGAAQQLSAGIPGQFANNAMSKASDQAISVATSRAGIQSGAPVGPFYNPSNDISNLMSTIGRLGFLRNTNTNTSNNSNTSENNKPWWIQGPGHGTVST